MTYQANQKFWYMRDNHTFRSLPQDDDEKAIAILRTEFDKGYTYGMLCASSPLSPFRPDNVHAKADFSEFEPRARAWLTMARNYKSPGDLEYESWAALPPQAKAEPAIDADTLFGLRRYLNDVMAEGTVNERVIAQTASRMIATPPAAVAKAEPAGVSDEAQAGDNWPWPVGALALGEVVRCLRETGRFVDEEGELTNALDDLLQRFDAESAAPSTGEREGAEGAKPSGDASAWWALVMCAAASIEDAANCLRDPDAKKQAEGAAKHYREAAQKLWGARGVAIPLEGKRHE